MNIQFEKLKKAFENAFRGIKFTLRHQQSFRIQAIIAAIIILFSFIFPLEGFERLFVLTAIILVLALELLNSVLEKIIDFIHPTPHSTVGLIKDMMAGVVLIVAIGAAIIGLVIFIPYFFN